MKNFKLVVAVLVLWLSFSAVGPAIAAKTATGNVVDSGSFGIFVSGKRVGTETFRVEQRPDINIISSEIKVLEGGNTQRSEMELTPNGDLRRYLWQEVQPGKAQVVVERSDEFLVERVISGGKEKTRDVSHMLPHSTAILDDNFFSQREILVWKFLASACTAGNGVLKCNPAPAQFGTLNPHQHVSSMVSLSFAGREKMALHGVDHDVFSCKLQTETGDWLLWFDENKKMVRIVIASENTEIIRD